MAERIQDLVQKILNECSRRDITNDSGESDQNAERGVSPPSRLSSIEPNTPMAKSTPKMEAPKRRSVHFPNLEEIQEENEKTENSTSVRLEFSQPPVDTLGLFLSMYQQHAPLNEYASDARYSPAQTPSDSSSSETRNCPIAPPILRNNVSTS